MKILKKLDELTTLAKEHFIKVAREVYKDYCQAGNLNEFQKIYITSSWRDRNNQYEILTGKLEKQKKNVLDEKGNPVKDENGNYKYWWTDNTYEYYQDTKISSKYLKIIQYLHDGKYLEMNEEEKWKTEILKILKDDFDAIENSYIGNKYVTPAEAKQKRENFEKIILNSGINLQNRKEKAKVILKQAFVIKELFNPSRHVGGDENNKQATALDIKFWEPYTKTATAFYDKHGRMGYSRYPSSDHYHVSFSKY